MGLPNSMIDLIGFGGFVSAFVSKAERDADRAMPFGPFSIVTHVLSIASAIRTIFNSDSRVINSDSRVIDD